MKTEILTKISYPGSFIRRVIVFQSFMQFVHYVAFAGIAFLGINYIFTIAGRHLTHAVLIAAFVGGFPAVLASMRAEFEYSGLRFAQAFELAKNAVLWSGYRCTSEERQTKSIKFTSKLPWPLKWRESNVVVETHGNSIKVSGPAIVARSVRRRLKNELSIPDSP